MIRFRVFGVPQPTGSKKPFLICKKGGAIAKTKGGFPIINTVDTNHAKAKGWTKLVKDAAKKVFDSQPIDSPIRLEIMFFLPRPKYHFGTGRNAGKLKPASPRQHITKPDVTKILRCTEDALTGILWVDDCQVCFTTIGKAYATDDEPAGADILVAAMSCP